jgi:hypothetical protein
MEIEMVDRPYNRMRYKTAGDFLYSLKSDRFNFIIAKMPTDYEALVFIHEFVEAYLCWKKGIPEKEITAFDKQFEKERMEGLHGEDDEPGDSKDAPYYNQHQAASKYEKQFCKQLGVKWKDYCDYIAQLEKK